MELELLPDGIVAERAAAIISAEARLAVSARGCFTFAVSGGQTPWRMLRALADQEMRWDAVHLFQVDERVAPEGDSDRNLTHLRECLQSARVPPDRIYPMPVDTPELDDGARGYGAMLDKVAGSPAVLDVVHLGLGSDGHTASLLREDPVLQVTDRDVAVTGTHEGRRRMTLTYPVLNRAHRIIWLVTGSKKAEMLLRLWNGDSSIPAGRVRRDHALVLADHAAAQLVAR